jgi:hypothetical protein
MPARFDEGNPTKTAGSKSARAPESTDLYRQISVFYDGTQYLFLEVSFEVGSVCTAIWRDEEWYAHSGKGGYDAQTVRTFGKQYKSKYPKIDEPWQFQYPARAPRVGIKQCVFILKKDYLESVDANGLSYTRGAHFLTPVKNKNRPPTKTAPVCSVPGLPPTKTTPVCSVPGLPPTKTTPDCGVGSAQGASSACKRSVTRSQSTSGANGGVVSSISSSVAYGSVCSPCEGGSGDLARRLIMPRDDDAGRSDSGGDGDDGGSEDDAGRSDSGEDGDDGGSEDDAGRSDSGGDGDDGPSVSRDDDAGRSDSGGDGDDGPSVSRDDDAGRSDSDSGGDVPPPKRYRPSCAREPSRRNTTEPQRMASNFERCDTKSLHKVS